MGFKKNLALKKIVMVSLCACIFLAICVLLSMFAPAKTQNTAEFVALNANAAENRSVSKTWQDDFLGGFFSNGGGSATVKDNVLEFSFSSTCELVSPRINGEVGNPVRANLVSRNTIALFLKNESPLSEITFSFTTDTITGFGEKTTKTFEITPNSDYKTYYFNISDLKTATGLLTQFKIVAGSGSGKFLIKQITFEKEAKICEFAGKINSCLINGDFIEINGQVDPKYNGKKVKLFATTLGNQKEEVEKANIIDAVIAKDNSFYFKVPLYGDKVSRLSSLFIAQVDGVKVSDAFKPSNYSSVSTNPYNFEKSTNTFNVLDFNAKGDGFTNDTAAIQSAINKAFESGGGTVVVGGDDSLYGKRYIASSLKMKSNTSLKLEKGAVLWQSQRASDYDYDVVTDHDIVMEGVNWSHAALCHNYPLILVSGAKNVSVFGEGVIRMADTGSEFTNFGNIVMAECINRIHIVPIGIYNSEFVSVSGVTITRNSGYHMAVYDSKKVFISDISLTQVSCRGGDGISIGCGSFDITLDNVDMWVSDDAVVLWSTSAAEPRGLRWWKNVPNKDNRVRNINILHSYICGGHGVTFIPWGSDAVNLEKQEISDIVIKDNIIGDGNTSIAGWFDNPYYGKQPFDNTEINDYSSIKNLTIQNNEIFGIATLTYVPATNIVSDSTIVGVTNFSNSGFNRVNGKSDFVSGLAYWSSEGKASVENIANNYIGKAESQNGKSSELFQGLNLKRGTYVFSADVMATGSGAKMFIKNMDGVVVAENAISNTSLENKNLSVKITVPGNYHVGVDSGSGSALIDNANMSFPINPDTGWEITDDFEDNEAQFDTFGFKIIKDDGVNVLASQSENETIVLPNLYGDFDFFLNFKPLNKDRGGVSVAFAKTINTYYNLKIDNYLKTLKLSRFIEGKEYVLATRFNFSLNDGFSQLLIKRKVGNIAVVANGAILLEAFDANPATSGNVEISNYGGKILIDDLEMVKFNTYELEKTSFDKFFFDDFQQNNKFFTPVNLVKREVEGNAFICSDLNSDNFFLSLPNAYDALDFKTKLRIDSLGENGVFCVRLATDSNNYFEVALGNGEIVLKENVGGKTTQIGKPAKVSIPQTQFFELGLSVGENKISVFIFGNKVLEENATIPEERNFVICSSNLNFSLDDLAVSRFGSIDFSVAPLPKETNCGSCASKNMAGLLVILPLLAFCAKRKV